MFAAVCRCFLLLSLGVGCLLPAGAQTPAPGSAPGNAAPAAAVPDAPAGAAQEGSPRPARPARAAARPAEPKGSCLVAEFRTMALTTHDGIERARKASEWLTKNGSACTFAQLAMLNANRASWMGTADTVQFMGQMDGTLEAKAKDSPELLAALYGTKPEPGARKSNDTTSASAQSTTPRQTVVPGSPAGPAAAGVVVSAGQAVAPGGAQVPGAPAAPGAPGGPGAAPAPAPKPPEIQKFFTTRLRDSVREHFVQRRGSDVCPSGTIMREMRCEAIVAARKWKMGQPVTSDLLPLKDVAPTLLERLGAPPAGHRFVQVGVDVLLLSEDMRVVDAVLDLGQVPPLLPTPKKT